MLYYTFSSGGQNAGKNMENNPFGAIPKLKHLNLKRKEKKRKEISNAGERDKLYVE